MKLTTITIHNFRTIHDVKFSTLDYSLLVGCNNAGKSAVIDAIRCFYEKDGYKYKKDRDFCWIKPDDEDSWIEMEFVLTKDEWDSLPDYCKLSELRLKVRKFFLTKEKDKNDNKKQDLVYAYKIDGSLNDEPFHGAKLVQIGKFGKLVYIPAVSTVDDHTKLTGPSALRDLLNDVLEDVIAKSTSFKDFETSFSSFSKSIKTDTGGSGRSISGLESELNSRIESWGTKFELSITQPSVSSIVKNLVEQKFIDKNHGEPQDISQYGSGFQRQFIFSIIDVASQYIESKTTIKKEFSPDYTLILFEEPEAFLHPPQQESLSYNLQKLATGASTQVLCSTHSPHFVSKNSHELKGLIKLNKVIGVTSTYQIDAEGWNKLIETNQVLNAIALKYPKLKNRLEKDDCLPEMEAVKYFLWLDPERSGLFFAEHVLLVEGPTEKALISRLINQNKTNLAEGDLTVVDTIGKYNTHRFMGLLQAYGINHSVLVDDDENKNEHEELNQLIKDSSGAYTKNISFLEKDLENVLGITSSHDHRKPQHIMYMYESGQINESKMGAFCTQINNSVGK